MIATLVFKPLVLGKANALNFALLGLSVSDRDSDCSAAFSLPRCVLVSVPQTFSNYCALRNVWFSGDASGQEGNVEMFLWAFVPLFVTLLFLGVKLFPASADDRVRAA